MSQFEKDYPSFISLLKIVVSLIWFISFAGGFFFGAMIIDAAFTGGAHIYVTGITK